MPKGEVIGNYPLGGGMLRHDKETLADACTALVRLVRVEYPEGKSLSEIAEVWGDASERELEALKRIEGGQPSAATRRGLPPALAGATDLRGEPRFYPFDEHPATARLRDQRRQLRLLLAQLEARQHEPEYIGSEDIKNAILQSEVAIRYVNAEIMKFEEGELRAQVNYLRTVS